MADSNTPKTHGVILDFLLRLPPLESWYLLQGEQRCSRHCSMTRPPPPGSSMCQGRRQSPRGGMSQRVQGTERVHWKKQNCFGEPTNNPNGSCMRKTGGISSCDVLSVARHKRLIYKIECTYPGNLSCIRGKRQSTLWAVR